MSSQIFETLLVFLARKLLVIDVLGIGVCNVEINLCSLIGYQMSWLFVQELFNFLEEHERSRHSELHDSVDEVADLHVGHTEQLHKG